MKKVLVCLLLGLLVTGVALAGCAQPAATPTPTAKGTPTPTPTAKPATPTPTPKPEKKITWATHQHEMGILNDVNLLERSSGVARDAKEMRARVRELEEILSAPDRLSLETGGLLVKDFQDAFRLTEGTSQARFISTATAIAAGWVDDLGMPGTIPYDETWQRLAEKLNLRMLVYSPDQNEIDGQPVKATLRITGEFTPGTTSRISGAELEAATVSTSSSQHAPRRHPADGGD